MREHEHADLLRAIADGKQMQVQDNYGHWDTVDALRALRSITTGDGAMVRVKPNVITTNSVDVPAPETEPLEDNQVYWLPMPNDRPCAEFFIWGNDDADRRWLRRRRIHLTKEAALAHAEAEIRAAGGEP